LKIFKKGKGRDHLLAQILGIPPFVLCCFSKSFTVETLPFFKLFFLKKFEEGKRKGRKREQEMKMNINW
jgi:hypothetical protein